jgi:uncharacterized peroxidase-related enzyme
MSVEQRDALVEGLKTDPLSAPVDGTDRAILEYSLKLTRTPDRMQRADVDALRQAGLDDRAIHDVCAIAAYYAFVNRIADGLGVEMERT